MVSQKQIASLAKITEQHLCHILAGRSDAGKGLANRLGKLAKTPPSLWVFGKKQDRRDAIDTLIKRMSGDN